MAPNFKNPWLIALIAVLSGAGYGVINYFVFRNLGGLMAPSFLFLVPLVVGLVAALLTPPEKPLKSYQNAALSILLIAIITTAWQYESLFCWIILAPIALVAAGLGAFIVNLIRNWSRPKARALFVFIFLPFVAFNFEFGLPERTVFQTTHSSILIQAPAAVVWQEIKSVPTISATEYKDSWTHRLGLPRPLDATLSYEGIGGVRIAGFSNGLSFFEEITDWQPKKTIAFSIKAQGSEKERLAFALGPAIGGHFVDVVSGRYTIEEISAEQSLLHLTSTQRLTSKLNAYAGFWVNAVMADLQNTILEVMKRRSEKEVF